MTERNFPCNLLCITYLFAPLRTRKSAGNIGPANWLILFEQNVGSADDRLKPLKKIMTLANQSNNESPRTSGAEHVVYETIKLPEIDKKLVGGRLKAKEN